MILQFVLFFWFRSYCLIVYIHLCCINTHQLTTTRFIRDCHSHGWWYYVVQKKYGSKVCVIFSDIYLLIIKILSIYPASTDSDKQQHHSTAIIFHYLVTSKRWDCIMGHLFVVREIGTWMKFFCFSYIWPFTTVTNQC